MDFRRHQEEAEFRAEARAFLAKHAPSRAPARACCIVPRRPTRRFCSEAREWQTKKYEAGFAGITWPKEWGGQGASPIQQVIYDQEEAQFSVPRGIYRHRPRHVHSDRLHLGHPGACATATR